VGLPINRSEFHDEIRRWAYFVNASCYWVQNSLWSRLPSKAKNIKMFLREFFRLLFYGRKTLSSSLWQEHKWLILKTKFIRKCMNLKWWREQGGASWFTHVQTHCNGSEMRKNTKGWADGWDGRVASHNLPHTGAHIHPFLSACEQQGYNENNLLKYQGSLLKLPSCAHCYTHVRSYYSRIFFTKISNYWDIWHGFWSTRIMSCVMTQHNPHAIRIVCFKNFSSSENYLLFGKHPNPYS
jgi:hypothetical protein